MPEPISSWAETGPVSPAVLFFCLFVVQCLTSGLLFFLMKPSTGGIISASWSGRARRLMRTCFALVAVAVVVLPQLGYSPLSAVAAPALVSTTALVCTVYGGFWLTSWFAVKVLWLRQISSILVLAGAAYVLHQMAGTEFPIATVQSSTSVVKTTDADQKGSSAAEAFRQWLSHRPDLEVYRSAGRPYPVFLIAAQGGGIYAAAQVATFLGRLQDRCPGFAQHVFAVSGVSGGSVGATMFHSLVQGREPFQEAWCFDKLANYGGVEKALREVLIDDHFSPIAHEHLADVGRSLASKLLDVDIPSQRPRALTRSLIAEIGRAHV